MSKVGIFIKELGFSLFIPFKCVGMYNRHKLRPFSQYLFKLLAKLYNTRQSCEFVGPICRPYVQTRRPSISWALDRPTNSGGREEAGTDPAVPQILAVKSSMFQLDV